MKSKRDVLFLEREASRRVISIITCYLPLKTRNADFPCSISHFSILLTIKPPRFSQNKSGRNYKSFYLFLNFFNKSTVMVMKMDLGRWVLCFCLLALFLPTIVSGNAVFRVQHKFKGRGKSLDALRAHDTRRHGRILSAVDLPLGGNGHPSEAGSVFLSSIVGSFGLILFDFLNEFWVLVALISNELYLF